MTVRGWHIYRASRHRACRQTGVSIVPPNGKTRSGAETLGWFLPLWRWRKP